MPAGGEIPEPTPAARRRALALLRRAYWNVRLFGLSPLARDLWMIVVSVLVVVALAYGISSTNTVRRSGTPCVAVREGKHKGEPSAGCYRVARLLCVVWNQRPDFCSARQRGEARTRARRKRGLPTPAAGGSRTRRAPRTAAPPSERTPRRAPRPPRGHRPPPDSGGGSPPPPQQPPPPGQPQPPRPLPGLPEQVCVLGVCLPVPSR